MDRTLILVKPDAFARSLTGEIIARFERKGLAIVALSRQTLERELAERHYAEHAERPFFAELVTFITSGPLVAMVLEGPHAVAAARQLIGATDPLAAAPGSIRGDFATETGREHRARLRLPGVSRARDRPVLPELRPRWSRRRLLARDRWHADAGSGVGVAAAARDPARAWASTSSCGRPTWRSSTAASRCTWPPPTRCARHARSPTRVRPTRTRRDRSWCSASTRWSPSHGRIYGKPRDEVEARATLAELSGDTHQVVSGLAVVSGAVEQVYSAVTAVTFRAVSDELMEWYLATGEWRGRAGGYAIQGAGAALVLRVEGDYENVVGLPLAALLAAVPQLLAAPSRRP